jgi:hypothetical protein
MVHYLNDTELRIVILVDNLATEGLLPEPSSVDFICAMQAAKGCGSPCPHCVSCHRTKSLRVIAPAKVPWPLFATLLETACLRGLPARFTASDHNGSNNPQVKAQESLALKTEPW